jgi:hypothetical protein
MVCPKCGNIINYGENFCRACGSPLNYTQNDYINNQNIVIDDNTLIKAYIGPNVDKLTNNSFSWCSFLFGGLYFFYRKMYLFGVITLLISFLLTYCVKEYSILLLVFLVIAGIYFKKYYVSEVSKKVERIKKENATKNTNDLIQICNKEGGTSVGMLILAAIVYGIVASFTVNEYSITNGSSGTINGLHYKIPTNFEESEYNTTSNIYYTYRDESNYCDFYIAVINSEYNISSYYYLRSLVSSNNYDTSLIKEKTINNKTWETFETNIDNNQKYYLIANNKEKLFDVEYSILYDDGYCSKAYKEFVNSLDFGD